MSISSLFTGMEAYLDGDVEINNNVGVPDDAAADAEIADQTAEVASDTADATEEAKDTEVASQMLSRMCDMYAHVKQFGIDRTFVSLYNRHGELDRVCGIQFPSCESMDVVGDRYSRYSTAFIAAMESSGSGLWAKIKAFVLKVWKWIKEKVTAIWNGILKLFGAKKNRLKSALQFIGQHKGLIAGGAAIVAGLTAGIIYHQKANQSPALAAVINSAKQYIAAIQKIKVGTPTIDEVNKAKGVFDKAVEDFLKFYNSLGTEQKAADGNAQQPEAKQESFNYSASNYYGYPGLEDDTPAAAGAAADPQKIDQAAAKVSAEQDKFIAKHKKGIAILQKLAAETTQITTTVDKAGDEDKRVAAIHVNDLTNGLQKVIAKLTSATQKSDKISCIDRVIQLGISLKNKAAGLIHKDKSADNAGANNGETPAPNNGEQKPTAMFGVDTYNFL